jgi:purine-nucleoside phosphorylase
METLPKYLHKNEKAITELVSIPYDSIPHFPCLTRSGRRGEICFANSTEGHKAPIIFLTGNSLESFNCEEGIFVGLLLSELGVSKLVHTFLASSSVPGVHADTVRIIGDATDYTTIAPVAQVKNQPQYMSTALFNTNASDLEDLKLAFRFTGQADTTDPLHYAHILGPSFPSRAEVNLATICDISLVGITSLSLVYASRSLGLDVVGICGVSYETGEDPLADASFVLWKKMRSIVASLLRGNFFPKHRSSNASKIRLKTSLGESQRRQQVSYHLPSPVSQGLVSDVQESADWLRGKGLFDEADLAVLVDSRIPELPFELGDQAKSVTYADVPKFPQDVEGSITWTTTAEGKKLIVLHGTVLFNEGRTNAEIGHSIRVLQQLKVQRVVFVNEVASYSHQAPLDSVVLLRDHFNLGGRNPLYGKNVPEFGIRFTDLGNVYTDTLRQAVRRCAQNLDLIVTEVTAAFVLGPVFASLADAAVIKACDSQVSCTGMIPEAIVARHAGIPLAAIGVVKSCVVEGELFTHSPKFKGRNQRAIVNLVKSLLSGL